MGVAIHKFVHHRWRETRDQAQREMVDTRIPDFLSSGPIEGRRHETAIDGVHY